MPSTPEYDAIGGTLSAVPVDQPAPAIPPAPVANNSLIKGITLSADPVLRTKQLAAQRQLIQRVNYEANWRNRFPRTDSGQPDQPDIGVLGRTMNGISRIAGVTPDIAAQLTRQLYSPALNHPQMQRMANNARTKISALVQAPGQLMSGMADAAKQKAPRPPLVIPPGLSDTAATLHVLLAGPTKPDPMASLGDLDINELTKDTDDDSSILGGVKSGISDAANGLVDEL